MFLRSGVALFSISKEKTSKIKNKIHKLPSGIWPRILYNPLTLRLDVVPWTSELAEVCQSVYHNISEVRDKKASEE